MHDKGQTQRTKQAPGKYRLPDASGKEGGTTRIGQWGILLPGAAIMPCPIQEKNRQKSTDSTARAG